MVRVAEHRVRENRHLRPGAISKLLTRAELLQWPNLGAQKNQQKDGQMCQTWLWKSPGWPRPEDGPRRWLTNCGHSSLHFLIKRQARGGFRSLGQRISSALSNGALWQHVTNVAVLDKSPSALSLSSGRCIRWPFARGQSESIL